MQLKMECNRNAAPQHRTVAYTLPNISLATLAGDIVDSENAVKFEMGDALKLHGAQT